MNAQPIALDSVRDALPSRRRQPQVAPQSAPVWALEDVDAALARFTGPPRSPALAVPRGRRDHVVDPGGASAASERPGTADQPLRRDLLIEYLHAIHDRERVLTTPHLHALAQRMRLAPVEVYEVASFYHHFEIAQVGDERRPARDERPIVRVCDGLSCSLAGAADLHAALEGALAGTARVLHAPCVGRCETAPVAVVHHNALPHASVEKVRKAVADKAFEPALPKPIGLAAYKKAGGYELWRSLVRGERKPDEIIQALDDAGLRGLGGAGFPAGRKWKIVRNEPAPRLMAINIDEGEPGTFKDRWYLERDPHRFLEGMLIAAWCVQVGGVYLYLRDEYHGLRALLEREIDALRADPSLQPLPPIELRRGAGAYICGEESAMIESIEGKRGMPRLRPPYVAQVGLFGRPTLEHNYETLHWVREIVERGAAWFASHGRHGRKGLRSFSVSGRVKHPGVKLAPAGITLRQLVDEHCGGMQDGHELYAYLPGGASGGILPASLADVPLDFDTIQPHGGFIGSAAVIVLSQQDRATDAARNLMKFFEDESCGQCTPCRAGTTKVRALIKTDRWDTALLTELSQVMRDASICGLGQAAPNPVDSVMRYFAHELEG